MFVRLTITETGKNLKNENVLNESTYSTVKLILYDILLFQYYVCRIFGFKCMMMLFQKKECKHFQKHQVRKNDGELYFIYRILRYLL